MGGLFGSSSGNSKATPRYTSMNIQTSAQGVCIPIHYGRNRVAPNIIWYGGFRSTPQKQSGKGGGGKGAKSYNYYADIIMALCEGVVTQVFQVYQGQSVQTLAQDHFVLFEGTQSQAVWSYLASKYPSQALAYSGTAYVAAEQLSLGTTPDLPDYSFEIAGNLWHSISGVDDVNPADIMYDYITNSYYGLSPGATWIDSTSLQQFREYCGAQGLLFSPYLSTQEQVTNTFQRWAQMTNSFIFWSGNVLKFVPLGAYALTGNGYSYTPQITPIYNISYADLLVESKGKEPVTVTRVDPADGYNQVQLDIRDRNNAYNNTSVYWTDPASINQYGQLMANIIEAQEICLQSIGILAAGLIGQRSVYIRNTYTFKLGYGFVLLEPGDIITLTEPNIGLDLFPVRIQSIQEDENQLLTIVAEEFPASIGITASQTVEAAGSTGTYDPNVNPGNVNPPAIFEPSPVQTNGAAEVWIGLSGGLNWGGAFIYISFDGGNTYSDIGSYATPIIQGELVNALPVHTDPDTSDTLVVDLTITEQVLPSTSTDADADAFRTLFIVDNEVMSYGTVAAGSTSEQFDLTYLRRGVYGTTIAAHSAGCTLATSGSTASGSTTIVMASVTGLVVGQYTNGAVVGLPAGARVTSIAGTTVTFDQATTSTIASGTSIVFLPSIFSRIDPTLVFTYTLPPQYVGQPLWFKFTSVNDFGNAIQDISDVVPYVYTPIGAAFTISPPGTPTLTASAVTQSDGTTLLTMTAAWSASPGPLVGSYVVEFSTNSGSTWTNGTILSASTLSYALSPALSNTNYLVRVAAVSQSGLATSAWATIGSAVNSGNLVTSAPATPTGITASAGAGSAVVSWTASTSASTVGYKVYYGTSSTFGSSTLYGVTTGSPILISGLVPSTLYYFWVEAYNGAGNSSPNGPATATPSNLSGGVVIQQGTVTNASTVTVGSHLTFTGSNLDWPGILVLEGTTSLGDALALDFGPGLNASLVSGTLSLSGTGLELIEGSTTLTNINELIAGTNITFAGTSSASATISSSGGGSGGGATFTNGTVSLVPSVVSISTGLGLVNDSTYPSSPTVVHSNTNSYPNSGSGSNSLFLSATPTLGNYVLIVVINAPGFGSGGTPVATSSMTLIADLEINSSGAYVSVYGGTVISGDPNPGLSNLGASSGIIYEFTGSTVSGVTAALVTVASSGSYVLSYTQSSLINSVVLSAFEIANLPTLSSPLPSGSTVDANIYNNQTVNLQVVRGPVVTGAATFSVTSSAPNGTAPNGVSIIVKGVQTASSPEVILTATGSISITDGVNTYSGLTELEFAPFLGVGVTGFPSVVQSAYGTNSVSLPSPVTVGNYLLAMIKSPAAPGSLGGLPQLVNSNGGGAAGSALYGAVAASTTSPTCSYSDSYIWLLEIKGVGTPTYGTYTPTGVSHVYTPGFSLASGAGFLFYTGDSAVSYRYTGTATSFAPTGTVVEQTNYTNDYTFGGFSAYSIGSPTSLSTASWSDSTTAYGNSVYISFPNAAGSTTGVITPSIPVTINGTLEGGFTAMTITTGNMATSASLSGSSLILNLGTP